MVDKAKGAKDPGGSCIDTLVTGLRSVHTTDKFSSFEIIIICGAEKVSLELLSLAVLHGQSENTTKTVKLD